MLLLYLCILLLVASLSIVTITVMGETAVQSFSKAKLFIMYKNHKNFPHVKNFKENITEIIFSSLIANYVSHAILGTIFTYITLEYLKVSMVYSSIILAFFTIVIEISTKKIAISYPEKTLLAIGYFYMLIHKICRRISILFDSIVTTLMVKIFKFKEHTEEEDSDLLSIVELKMEEDQTSGQMIKNILEMKRIYVEDVMTPKNDIISVNFNKKIQVMKDEIYHLEEDCMKEYLPIWHEKKNIYIGVINVTKFFISLKKKNMSFHSMMEEMLFVPSNTNIYKMLQMFQKHSTKFAFVVNEYGDVIGIVTIRDILEEIVGNDIFEDKKITDDNQVLVLDGDMSVKELKKYFNHNFFSEDTYSINDLIINEAKCIPEEGSEFIYQNVSFIVLDREDNKIDKVLVTLKKN